MRYKRKKRNAPIATLIKNYINKKSGKVSESRKEIKWRFNWLDWKDQKRILTAFLDSGRSDRDLLRKKASFGYCTFAHEIIKEAKLAR